MRKIRRYGKATALVIIIAAILGLAVYGLITLINNLTDDEAAESPSNKPGVSSGPIINPEPSDTEQVELPSETAEPAENMEITVSYGIDGLVITNPGTSYSYANRTGVNELTISLPGKKIDETGYTEVGTSDLIDGYSIKREGNSIVVIVNANEPFTIKETIEANKVAFSFIRLQNTHVMEYRNDLSRIYMNIQEARLSKESDSFVKRYTEIFDETNLTYTITIAKSLMPSLVDELLVFNDGTLKTIEIINRDKDIQLVFTTYGNLIIYPNTRDYDAAFTFIKPRSSDIPLIVLDPGHGGIDGGTTSADGSILEKNIVMKICGMITERLVKNGFDVMNLREEDIFLGLMERTDIANLAEADAIISVHINSYTAEYVNGATTLYKTSEELAASIQSAVISMTGANDMGTVRMNDLSILNRAEMDSVIIETGFLSNEDEAKLLNDSDYQKKIADGIAEGIELYFKGE